MDRKGRRVFCAKFDRIPKWGHRHNITMPKSISATEFPIDDESIQLVSRFFSGEDGKDSNDEDYGKDSNDEEYAIYERDTSIPMGYESDMDYISIK